MSALRYYDFPTPDTQVRPRRKGLIDRFCARLWAWASEGQRKARLEAELTDEHLRRDIGLDGDNDRNWL
jgi:hypothetical protein